MQCSLLPSTACMRLYPSMQRSPNPACACCTRKRYRESNNSAFVAAGFRPSLPCCAIAAKRLKATLATAPDRVFDCSSLARSLLRTIAPIFTPPRSHLDLFDGNGLMSDHLRRFDIELHQVDQRRSAGDKLPAARRPMPSHRIIHRFRFIDIGRLPSLQLRGLRRKFRQFRVSARRLHRSDDLS